VRADERLDYGKVMTVVKLLYKVKITKMALVTLAE
jgi:biopolymer transport protein ExbD